MKRRQFLQSGTVLALASLGTVRHLLADAESMAGPIIKRTIPVTGEQIPVIGMGSWITFDVGYNDEERAQRVRVLEAFFERGGGMIDSSPMYGTSEEVIGHCLEQLDDHGKLFSATKVWILGQTLGIQQMKKSMRLWGVSRFDLMQIHNLLDWESHLETLKQWKAEGKIRYIGVTTSHGRRHDELEQALQTGAFDFVQFTYNIIDREAESRLLPLAKELGCAVIINRPFRRGALFDEIEKQPLPDYAREFDCHNWAQFFLKFIVSHPSVTCAIPATSQVAHMHENMGAAYGRLPEPSMRKRMIDSFNRLA